MPVPVLTIAILHSGATIQIEQWITQETNSEVLAAIERPHEVNNFVAPELALKGRDRSGFVKSILETITPTSTDFRLLVGKSGVYGGGIFFGFILPNTVQFDPIEGWFTFTAIGIGRFLATTDATNLFKRSALGWTLAADGSPRDTALQIQATGNPDDIGIVPGDQIQLGTNDQNEKFQVIRVTPSDGQTVPPITSWEIGLNDQLVKGYATGVPVSLLTPYQRNVPMHDLVNALFTASGIGAPFYAVDALPDVGRLFLSPVSTSGINAPVLGITPSTDYVNPLLSGQRIWLQTAGGLYEQSSPPDGAWSLLDASVFAPGVDPTNYGVNLQLFGEKRTRGRAAPRISGGNWTMKFYGYDLSVTASPFHRYVLTVSVNADQLTPNGPYPFTIKLDEQFSTDKVTWGGTVNVWAGETDSTVTPLQLFYASFGIDVDPATGVCFFIDFTVGGVTDDPGTFALSSYSSGTGIQRAIVADQRGDVQVTSATGTAGGTKIAVFFVDGQRGEPATVYSYTVDGAGLTTLYASASVSPYIVGSSIKFNDNDGRFYALMSDPLNGVFLESWADETFTADPAYPPQYLGPPVPIQHYGGIPQTFRGDLIVWKQTPGPGAGVPFPMYELTAGSVPFFISNRFSGLITYANLDGLSCADALQQLSIIVDAFFYLDNSTTSYFRSRSIASGIPIGIDDQVETGGLLLPVRTQPVWSKGVLFVRVENPDDPTIFGEAGDAQYAATDSLNLTVSSRFISGLSFARAIAQNLLDYLGRQLRAIDIQHVDDGRNWSLGNTCHMNLDGANRELQIFEVSRPLFGKTVRVQAVEL